MARLRAEASRRQTSVEAVIEEWAASLPTKNRPTKRQQPSFVALGASRSGRRASEADDYLADLIGDHGEPSEAACERQVTREPHPPRSRSSNADD